MRPMLSVKVIDGDTGIELDKLDRLIAPTELDYEFIDDIMMYRIYRWNFAYSIARWLRFKIRGKDGERKW